MWKMHISRSRPPLPAVAQPGATFEFPYSSECKGAAAARSAEGTMAPAEAEADHQPMCVEKILAYAMLWQQTP